MSISQLNTVDAIGIDRRTGECVLTVADHLEWDNLTEHLLLLKEKLNTYIAFVESGEIYQTYPDSRGKDLVFDVVGKYALPPEAEQFLSNANETLRKIDIAVRFRRHETS